MAVKGAGGRGVSQRGRVAKAMTTTVKVSDIPAKNMKTQRQAPDPPVDGKVTNVVSKAPGTGG